MLNTSIHILIKLPPQMSYKSTFMITSSPKKQQKADPEMGDGGKIKGAVHNIFDVVLVFVYLRRQSMNIKFSLASYDTDNRWDKNGLDETQRPLFGKTYVSMYRLRKI